MKELIPYRTRPEIQYNDLYLRMVSCLIASHMIVAYGETLSFFEMLVMPYYYYALLPSFAIAITLFAIIRAISIRLDRKFDWTERIVQRITTQVFFGFIVPAICAFLLAFGYFVFRGINIFTTSYLQYDFQFILLQLLLINLYYVAAYFYQKWSHAEKAISKLVSQQTQSGTMHKGTFTVSKGASNLLLDVDDIAYFYREEESNYLRTTKGEDYFINSSLDEAQEQLPEEKFFRMNRQIITHRQAVQGYDLMEYGKLEAKLYPSLSIDTVVSQKRAKDFKQWIDNGLNHE